MIITYYSFRPIHVTAILMVIASGFQTLSSQNNIFVEVSEQVGLERVPDNFGIAIGDYNNDGLDDIYVSRRSGVNQLWRNEGEMRFTEVGEGSNVAYANGTRTALWVDLNNDDYPELYLGNDKTSDVLYANLGDGTFEDITAASGIINPGNTFSVNTSDINLDGLPDLYVSNFLSENSLFINRGDLIFSPAASDYGVEDRQKSMANLFFDYDNDGDQDLYLVHDGNQPNMLLENTGVLPFEDRAKNANADYAGQGMGVDAADINNDGWLYLYITNLYENTLLLNNGDGSFSDISAEAGVDDYGMGWGTTFLDFDNDGWVDLYVCNDSYFSPYPNVLYKNNGDRTFSKVEVQGAIASSQAGYGCVSADLDQDGFMDLLVANEGANDYVEVFQNTLEDNNWVAFYLRGTTTNRSAVGAKIMVIDDAGIMHFDEVTGGNGFAGQNAALLHFGLGQATAIDSIHVEWPGGSIQPVRSLDINTYYTIEEGEAASRFDNLTVPVHEERVPSGHLKVVPNPIGEKMRLTLSQNVSGPADLSLWMSNGQLLYATRIVMYNGQTLIDIPKRSKHSGFVIARLSVNGRTYSQKLIKLDP